MINSMSQEFRVQDLLQIPNSIGGFDNIWDDVKMLHGFLDMVSGSDLDNTQAAIVEESTHILISSMFVDGITDNMRVVDKNNRVYEITYADNPMGICHHNELYLKFVGELSG